MIDATLVTKIEELALQGQARLIEVAGVKYSTAPLVDLRKEDPEPDTLGLSSLQGIVDYLGANHDDLATEKLLLHVASPTQVTLCGPLEGHFKQRARYVQAEAVSCLGEGFRLEQYYGQQLFLIGLQVAFADGHQRAELLELAGNLTNEEVGTQVDDGVTQKVSARAGVTLSSTRVIKNPFVLAPYRTFREVEQPESPFIFRVKRKEVDQPIGLALYEADGGAWELKAVERVKAWLKEKLPEITVIG